MYGLAKLIIRLINALDYWHTFLPVALKYLL